MTIYDIRRGAGSRFLWMKFVHDEDGSFSKWKHLASPDSIASIWTPPKLRFYEPGESGLPGDSKKRPRSKATDMPYVYGHGLLVVSARLVEQCGEVLRQFGELLPVECSEGTFFAYHCTHVLDCLDEERSRLSRSSADGRILNVYDPVFRPDRLSPRTVFRIPVGNPEIVFCDDQVHAMLTAAPLEGVTADVVWKSDGTA
jgi:hypothetical protein